MLFLHFMFGCLALALKYNHGLAKQMADLNNGLYKCDERTIKLDGLQEDGTLMEGKPLGQFGWKVSKTFVDDNEIKCIVVKKDKFQGKDKKPICTVSFPGTLSYEIYDYLLDLNLDPTRILFLSNPPTETRVHTGFFERFDTIRRLGVPEYLSDECSKGQLLITGHGLGGAVAELFGQVLTHGIDVPEGEDVSVKKFSDNENAVQIYTFGEPHIYTYSRLDNFRQRFLQWFQRPIQSCPPSDHIFRMYTADPQSWYEKVDVIPTMVSGKYFYHCACGYEVDIQSGDITQKIVRSPFSSSWKPLWRSLKMHDFPQYQHAFNGNGPVITLKNSKLLDSRVVHPVALNNTAWMFILLPFCLCVLLVFTLSSPSCAPVDFELELKERLMTPADGKSVAVPVAEFMEEEIE